VAVMGGKRQEDGLTEKERRFVVAYVGECAGNATAAVRAAKYAAKNDAVAANIGSELLRKPQVSDAIARSREEIKRASILTLVEQEELLTKIATGEIADVHVVRTKEGNEAETREVPVAGRLAAIDQLGKRHGAYAASKHEVSGPNGGPIQVETWAQRLQRKAAQYAAEKPTKEGE